MKSLLVAALLATAPIQPAPGLAETEVSFANLNGSILYRADLDLTRKHPGVVLVHGSGNSPRSHLTQEAEAFARAGIIALIYDKRSDYSRTHRDFSALADDALAGIRKLRGMPGVDPDRVGLWGLSEGGWVAPLAASRAPGEVSFLITIGAPGLTPARTQAWNLNNRLTRAGVAPSTADAVVSTGMGIALALGQFPAADHDPVPVLRAVKQPVLAIWGELDTQVPPRESAEIFRRELVASPGVTIRILPRGGHAGRVTTDGYDRVGGPVIDGFRFGELSPGYQEMMTEWILNGHVLGSTSDSPPAQTRDSAPVSPTPALGFAAFGVIVLALISWPVAAPIRRLRGIRGRPQGARAARWLAATGLASAIGMVSYPIYAVANSGKGISGFVLGQPLPWLILRLVTVAAVCCAVATAIVWWRSRSARLAIVTLGGLLLLPFALATGI